MIKSSSLSRCSTTVLPPRLDVVLLDTPEGFEPTFASGCEIGIGVTCDWPRLEPGESVLVVARGEISSKTVMQNRVSVSSATPDPRAANNSAEVSLDVLNRPPEAGDDGPVVVAPGDSVSIDVLANDHDADGDAISVVSVGAPTAAARRRRRMARAG